MNIHEAATSGKPFTNPDMIGAWMIVDGRMCIAIASMTSRTWIGSRPIAWNGTTNFIDARF